MKVRSLFAAGLLMFLTSVCAQAETAFQLLMLDGNFVKWGQASLGSGAVITYEFAAGRLQFDSATNCRQIEPLKGLLQRSHIDKARARRELKQAFAAWEAVADIHFRPATKGEIPDIIIGAEATPLGRAFTDVAYVNDDVRLSGTDRGLTSLKLEDTAAPQQKASGSQVRAIARSLICLNPQKRWKIGFDSDLDAYDLRFTLIHEIGHSIGLDHAGASGEVMSFKYLELFRRPQSGDIAGAIRLYGSARKN